MRSVSVFLTLLPLIHSCLGASLVVDIAGRNVSTSIVLSTSFQPQYSAVFKFSGGGGGGLVNQHLKLLTLLTLAIHLRVDAVVVPPAVSRKTFEDWSTEWRLQEQSTLWDVNSIHVLLKRHGIRLIVQNAKHDVVQQHNTLILPTYFCCILDIEMLTEDIMTNVYKHLSESQTPPSNGTVINMYAPDLLLALRTDTLPLYAYVAAAVNFAPQLTGMADAIVSRMRAASNSMQFNGLHLRVEGDVQQAHRCTIESQLDEYAQYVTAAYNGSNLPLYIASGIFLPDGLVNMPRYNVVDTWLTQVIVERRHASSLFNRQLVYPQEQQLHSEASALVDFLVLLQAASTVVSRLSSFSFVVREYRYLLGHTRNSTVVAGAEGWKGFFEFGSSFNTTEYLWGHSVPNV